MLKDCGVPITLPAEGLTVAEVQKYWMIDRHELLTCGELKEALERYYRERDKELLDR